MECAREEIKSNQEFWITKIERNMKRDDAVTGRLRQEGWVVLRFWGHEIKKELDYCMSVILDMLHHIKQLICVQVLVVYAEDLS